VWEYRVGHIIDELRKIPDESVQMVVTSPPYWGLRIYSGEQEIIWGGDEKCKHEWTEAGGGLHHENRNFHSGTQDEVKGQGPLVNVREDARSKSGLCQKCGAWRGAFGLEPEISLYVEHTVQILREIRRVLRKDGVVFWNIGDSYATRLEGDGWGDYEWNTGGAVAPEKGTVSKHKRERTSGLKPKDLCLIPFRVALAVQADGWWCRSDIVWVKPNPMPESCTDRPTKSHEYIFLFTKSKDYYWDQEAVRESSTCADPASPNYRARGKSDSREKHGGVEGGVKPAFGNEGFYQPTSRNIRSVWTIATQPYAEAHFATFPEELPERCIKAGSSERGNCPDCGAPWVRAIKRKKTPRTERTDNPNIGGLMRCPAEIDQVTTMGWRPTCSHYPRTNEWVEYIDFEDTKNPTAEELSENERRAKVQAELLEFWKPLKTIPALILDPFAGSGTTLWVARRLGRHAIGIDISNQYKELGTKRAKLDVPAIESYGD